jgi:hypothetical protein
MKHTTEISKAAAALGRMRTEKKAAAVRINGRKGGAARRVFSADDITADAVLKIHRAATDAAWGIGSIHRDIITSDITPAGAAKEINRLLATIERATK